MGKSTIQQLRAYAGSARYFIKIREVRSRYCGHPSTFEAQILERAEYFDAARWRTVGTSRRHATREAALAAGLKCVDRRGLTLENDPRKVADYAKAYRRVALRDQFGDD